MIITAIIEPFSEYMTKAADAVEWLASSSEVISAKHMFPKWIDESIKISIWIIFEKYAFNSIF